MADEEKDLEQFTGYIDEISEKDRKGPAKVTIKAKKSDDFAKTFRVWQYEYNEDPDEDREETELFKQLEAYEDAGTKVTVEFEIQEYKSRGQKRKQNLIKDVWEGGKSARPDSDDEDAGDEDDDKGKEEKPEKKPEKAGKGDGQDTSYQRSTPQPITALHEHPNHLDAWRALTVMAQAGTLAKMKDDAAIMDRAVEVVRMAREIERRIKDGEVGSSEAAPGLDAEIYEDFLKQASEEDIGEKAIAKKYKSLFPGKGAWNETGTVEELSAVAEALEFNGT